MTEAQVELLRDKYVLWERASRTGNMEMRDYNARCAEALKAALCIVAASPESLGVSQDEPAPSDPSTAWRGIESAPKDGTFILATGGGLEESMDVIQYSPRTGCWSCSQITLDDRDDEAEGYNRPTHWMPLPGAPS